MTSFYWNDSGKAQLFIAIAVEDVYGNFNEECYGYLVYGSIF